MTIDELRQMVDKLVVDGHKVLIMKMKPGRNRYRKLWQNWGPIGQRIAEYPQFDVVEFDLSKVKRWLDSRQ